MNSSALRDKGASIQDQVAEKLDLQDMLKQVRAAAN